MPLSATGWTPSTQLASATKMPKWWASFRSAHGPSAIQNTGNAAGTRPETVVTSMALLTGEDHKGLATALYAQVGLAAQ
jgi:hypothetical protein